VADHEPSKFGHFIQTYSAFLSSFVIGVAGLIATSIWQYRQSQIAEEQSHAQQAAAKAKADSDWRIARAEILGKNLNVLSAQGANTADQRFGVLLSLTRGNIIDPELAVSYALELGRDNADYMRSVLASTTDKNYWQLAQAFKLTCLQRFGVARAAEICKDDKLAERSDAIAQLFQDELEAASAVNDVQHGPMSVLRDERQVQEWPGKMAWLFEPYLQDLYERRLWKDIDHFESASIGARLVGALVLATARTGELVSASEASRVEAFHADQRKWLVSYLLGSTCDADCRGRLVDVMLSSYGEAQGDYDEPLKRLLLQPRGEAGAPARPAALVPGRLRRPGRVPRPRADAGRDPGAVVRAGKTRPRGRSVERRRPGRPGCARARADRPQGAGGVEGADDGHGGARASRRGQVERSLPTRLCEQARGSDARAPESAADDQEGQLLQRRRHLGERPQPRSVRRPAR
jgi:hypothetical protein